MGTAQTGLVSGVAVHVEAGSPGADGDTLDSVTHAMFRSEARELGGGENAGHPLDLMTIFIKVDPWAARAGRRDTACHFPTFLVVFVH